MKINVFPLQPERFYHIYNRGIDGGNLYFEEPNYYYFLKLIIQKVKPIAKIYSYCFLPSHFHILVQIRTEAAIRAKFPDKTEVGIEKIIGHQFANTFNSYTQAVNKRFNRTGKLFELPFRRKEILTQKQMIHSILHIHKNPAKHHLVQNVFSYPHSSLQDILHGNDHVVESLEVLALFKGSADFKVALERFTS